MNKTLATSILVSLLALSTPTLAQDQQNTSPPTNASTPTEQQSSAPSNAVVTSIDINTASAERLALLSGIGAVKAAAIVTYREQNGAFESVEDLTKVSGIGPATIEKNRHLLSN